MIKRLENLIGLILAMTAVYFNYKAEKSIEFDSFLTLFTFMTGFLLTTYFTISATKTAKRLSEIGKFKETKNLFSNAIMINGFGLFVTIFAIATDFNYLKYVIIFVSCYSVWCIFTVFNFCIKYIEFERDN